jgi:RHS repeat-associated protein
VTVNTLTFTYDAGNNMLTATNANGTYTFAYDALNRVSATQEPFGLTLTATYDAVSNRTKLQDSFGGVLTSVYDAANRLTSRQFGGTSQTPLRLDLTYTNRDQVASITRYSDLSGTTKVGSTSYVYDAVGRLTNLQHKDSTNALLANYTYGYDLASRVTTEKLNGGATTSFAYDVANQLTSDGTNNYTFDLNGNRTMTGYTTGTGNQLTNDGTWTYSYDAEGNMTKKTKGASLETWEYGYDNIDHLTSVKQESTDGGTVTMRATYVYDAFGQRLEKDVWTQASGTTVTRFGYDHGNVWVDMNGSNALQTRRLYLEGVDQVFARIDSGGTAAWYLPDRLGSIRDVTTASGAVQDHINYDGFGNITNETFAANGDRYKWTGRELDNESGLQNNRKRYFDQLAGRWTTQDPINFAAGDSNLYRYVGNSAPLKRDPTGEQNIPGSVESYEQAWKARAEAAKKEFDRKVKEATEQTISAMHSLVDANVNWTEKEKTQIKEYLQRYVMAAHFPWDKPTGCFGNCDDWLFAYQTKVLQIEKDMKKDHMEKYMQSSAMFWDNYAINWAKPDAGHSAYQITLSDGTTFYLDDGNIGGLDHVFMANELGWYYEPRPTWPFKITFPYPGKAEPPSP